MLVKPIFLIYNNARNIIGSWYGGGVVVAHGSSMGWWLRLTQLTCACHTHQSACFFYPAKMCELELPLYLLKADGVSTDKLQLWQSHEEELPR